MAQFTLIVRTNRDSEYGRILLSKGGLNFEYDCNAEVSRKRKGYCDPAC